MSKSFINALVLTATLAGAAMVAAPTTADAGYKFRSYSFHRSADLKPVYHRPVYYVAPAAHYAAPVAHDADHGCGYFYKQWQWTGSHHWKHKSFACNG